MVLGLHGISINPVVLTSLVPKLFDQIWIFAQFDISLKMKYFILPWGKREFFANFVEFKHFCESLSEKIFLNDFRESGGKMESLISLFFAFSALSTVWVAEIAVFTKILWKKSGF